MKRLSFLLIVLLLGVAAGCASPAASPSEAAATATPEPTPEPTEPPSSEGALPSFEPGAGDLARVLPTEIGGLQITYQSSSGEDAIASGDLTPEEQAVFDRLGASPSDVTVAFGTGGDPASGDSFIIISAIQVEGADESALREEFLASMEDSGGVGEETTVGGKQVIPLGASGEESGYVYVKGDIAFSVFAIPTDLAAEALSQLP